jgi:hypothetical protein
MDPDISKSAVDLRKGVDSALESFRTFCMKALDPKNVTEENSKFCQVVLALCTAAESNYEKLRDTEQARRLALDRTACFNLIWRMVAR